MDKLQQFILENEAADSARLILSKEKYPEIDINLAINIIESRKKIRKKLPSWYDKPELIFPFKLSAEQSSSESTSAYKANIAQKLGLESIADLTGGMGVDSWAFSRIAKEVFYNEMQPELAAATEKNFKIFGLDNVRFSSVKLYEGNIDDILSNRTPDLIFLDPARRADSGKKVFRLEDCQPDVLTLREHLLKKSKYLMIKLSPMADIDMILRGLGTECKEVHIISQTGECKEVLVLMERAWQGGTQIIAADLDRDFTLKFTKEEEMKAGCTYLQCDMDFEGRYLLEPSKAITKAGCFKLLCLRYEFIKLAPSTHLYLIHKEQINTASKLGKIFKIKEVSNFDKKAIKKAGLNYPNSEVSAKSIPLTSDELRKKLSVKSGNDAHIWGLGTTIGRYLLITERITGDF